MLSWSASKWGWAALFIIALCESSWFPIPPDILLIALCIGATKRSFRFASLCLAGSIIGAMLGYGIGHFLWISPDGTPTDFANFFYEHIFSVESFEKVGNLYDRFNFWIVFTAGFTPLPYKIFTIAGGMFDINFPMFIVASIISRGMRFFLIAWLIWKYGAPIKVFIDKYFNLLASLFTLLLIGFVFLAVWLFGRNDNEDTKPIENAVVEEVATITEDNTLTLNEACDTTDL